MHISRCHRQRRFRYAAMPSSISFQSACWLLFACFFFDPLMPAARLPPPAPLISFSL